MHPKTREKLILTVVGWVAAGLIFFPIFWMVLTSFKTEVEAVATPPQLFFTADARELRHGPRARRLHSLRAQQRHHLGRRHPARDPDRRAGRLRHGVLPGQADQGSAALDAVDQDDAGGRRADPDLSAVPRSRRDRHALGPDRRLHADEPADRGVDALHLLQGGARRTSSRPAAWMAPSPSRRSGCCCCRCPCRASPRPPCCRSSCAGTRRSGASTSRPPTRRR